MENVKTRKDVQEHRGAKTFMRKSTSQGGTSAKTFMRKSTSQGGTSAKTFMRKSTSQGGTSAKTFMRKSTSQGGAKTFMRKSTSQGGTSAKTFMRKHKPLDPQNSVEEAVNVISDSRSTPVSRARLLIDRTIGLDNTKNAHSYLSSWIAHAWRPILWAVAWSTALSVVIALAYVLFYASTWGVMLGMLQYIGVNIVPEAILAGLQNAGIGLGTQMTVSGVLSLAQRNKKVKQILEKKIPDQYIRNAMRRVGVDTRNMRVSDVSTAVLSNGISAAYYISTGNPYGFIYAAGLNVGIKAGASTIKRISSLRKSKKVKEVQSKRSLARKRLAAKAKTLAVSKTVKLGKSISKNADEIKNVVAMAILDGPTSDSVEEDVVQQIILNEPRVKRRMVHESPPDKTETIKGFVDVLAENKKAVFATTAALSLVGLALSGNAEGFTEIMKVQASIYGGVTTEKMGEIAISGFNIVKESALAKTALTNFLINKMGMSKLTKLVSDKITPGQKTELKNLAEAIKHERNQSTISKLSNKFVGILTGGYHTTADLKKMSKRKLVGLYQILNPKDKNAIRYTESQLRDFIIHEQSIRLKRINGIVSNFTQVTLSAVAANVVQKSVVEGYAYYGAKMKEIDEALAKIEQQKADLSQGLKEREISQGQARLEKIQRRREAMEKIRLRKEEKDFEEGLRQREKSIDEARKLKEDIKAETRSKIEDFKEARKLRMKEKDFEEGLRQREKSIDEARKLKEGRKSDTRSKIEDFKEARKLRMKAKDLERSEKFKTAVDEAEKRAALRKLRESALAEKLAREADIIIIEPEGQAHPLPPEEIILPEALQEALDWEFTPAGQYAMKEMAKASTSWIPGVGWIQGTIQKINFGLNAAEITKDLGKVAEVITRLEAGESGATIKPTLGKLDDIMKLRIPNINTLIEDVITTDKLNAKEIVLRALKDKIINGWDNKKLAYEIGKKFLGGSGENFGVDITESYGAKIWEQSFQ